MVRLLLFFTVFSAMGVLVTLYLRSRLGALADRAGPRAGQWARRGVVLVGLLPFLSMALMGLKQVGPIADPLHLIGWFAFGLFAVLLAANLLVDLGGLALRVLDRFSSSVPDPGRRAVLLGFARGGASLGAGALALVGLPAARALPKVREVDVAIAGLNPALQGFRIAQISDVHIGPTIRGPWLAGVVDRINGLSADMVAITGDLVDGDVPTLGVDVSELARLQSKHGTFFCVGNHEYYSGVDAWVAELDRIGVRPLLNAHVAVQHGAASVLVAGVTDYSAHRIREDHRSDPALAIAGRPTDGDLRILLAHQPRSAYAAADLDFFHLQLSGHTHGGQFAPFSFLIGLFQPFAVGLHQLGKMWIYTNPGTGYWGPPNRAGQESEITLIRFVST